MKAVIFIAWPRPPISSISCSANGVDHATGAEEEQRLEEGVVGEVRDAGDVRRPRRSAPPRPGPASYSPAG